MENQPDKLNSYINYKAIKPILILILIVLSMAACSPVSTQPTLDIQGTLAANVAGTLTASAPTPAIMQIPSLPIPTITQAPQPTAIYGGLPALVNVLNIVMRSGPSTLFDRITTFPQGTQITIMGKISNNEWVMVKDPQAGLGWMSAQFLSPVDLSGVPIVNVPASYTITGNVLDMLDQGVDGIGLAVFQGNGADQRRADTYSALDGSFVVYLPDTSQGVWNVGTAGIKCTSRVMDANCNATGSIITPTYSIALPQTVSLLFNYDPAKP
jgi:hypothetical protein